MQELPNAWLSQIGIGIATKDRWDDLFFTLQKLEEFGLGANETLVLDDVSREPVPQRLRDRFPRVRFERSTRPGYVAGQRNILARSLASPYFLEIDDDSFPVLGDLAGAVAWLAARPDVLALAFVVAERAGYEEELSRVPIEPFPCHYFIGCAALIKRELFLAAGAYNETLQYMCEEIDLSVRVRLRGLSVYQYPGVVVRHNRSPLSRDKGHRGVLLIRNELTIAALHYPFPFLLIRWPLFTAKAFLFGWVPGRAIVRGIVAALRLLPTTWPRRRALPIGPFLVWKRLPRPIKYA